MSPGLSSSSSAVATTGGKQLIKLGTRLVVGITIDGTLLKYPPHAAVHRYRLRPYLSYFGKVLNKLKCDVTLFTQAGSLDWDFAFRRFRHELCCPQARFVQDDGSLFLQGALTEVAASIASRPDRILFLNCRASHSVNLNQLLVLEPMIDTRRLRGTARAKAEATPESKTVALTVDDYSLVAAAEMIKELASSDVPVASYLSMEPLVETIRVPMYGPVNALPIENCDHIEQLDLELLEVSEPIKWDPTTGAAKPEAERAKKTGDNVEVDDGVPEIKETKEHADMFK
ncbi:Hypothetical protein, putative [Bodo saltans]|uniref:FCP1 homology domain-containing protein n=1 Tax=Bodo saltans TaxID=75058 RepID=A0A0S4IKE1_BODSA|nr:Hypothetical protein, putative [Bodo saltans]|eukprot:CUE59173.1 Hypothetical protein, putative [Bodo saltans]